MPLVEEVGEGEGSRPGVIARDLLATQPTLGLQYRTTRSRERDHTAPISVGQGWLVMDTISVLSEEDAERNDANEDRNELEWKNVSTHSASITVR